MPWAADDPSASDGFDSGGATVDLPAEYFILLPLVGHRRLFFDFDPGRSPFLRPLTPPDQALMDRFAATDSWRMMKILHASFRELAPSAVTLSVGGSANEAPPAADDSSHYRLLER